MVEHGLVEVIAPEVGIAVGADDFENLARGFPIVVMGDFKNRDVEGTASEVEHNDFLVFAFIESVGKGRSRRFVDDPGHFQACDLARIFGGLSLSVVEVGRDRDDGFAHAVSEVGLGRLLELAQYLCRNLLRSELLVTDLDFDVLVGPPDDLVRNNLLFGFDFRVSAAHKTFDRVDRATRVGDRLAASGLTDDGFAFVIESNDARGQTVPFGIGNDLDLRAFHDSDHRIGGSQIDTDDLFARCHGLVLPQRVVQ